MRISLSVGQQYRVFDVPEMHANQFKNALIAGVFCLPRGWVSIGHGVPEWFGEDLSDRLAALQPALDVPKLGSGEIQNHPMQPGIL